MAETLLLPGVQNAIALLEWVRPHLSRAALSLAVASDADCWLHGHLAGFRHQHQAFLGALARPRLLPR